MADRPRYTRTELSQYFERIRLPAAHRVYDLSTLGTDASKLAFLALLTKHSLVAIPFENLTQHYSWHRVIDVSSRHVFRKIVSSGTRGGYCMENNTLLHTALLSLGFAASMAGARVYEHDHARYGGFSHCVNVVAVGAARYFIDVGFGPDGPTAPMPLVEGAESRDVAGGAHRLAREAIPQNVDQGCRMWIYQHRRGRAEEAEEREEGDGEWRPLYCFVDFEFLPEDIRGMNLGPWRSPHSWFTQKVVLTRFTTDREVDGEQEAGSWPGRASEEAIRDGTIDGAVILFQNTLKWRRGGETRMRVRLENEAQRVDAMRKYFGIELADEDREAIRGTVGELASGVTM
ncbi:arylamine N-acetyltransferase 3 [Xylariaceae sp. FL0662B]|nr:arylamine N-acetyltransferase 3 [Xylariaceae sp. FL0662B]